MVNFFIRRPIFATVLALLMLLIGGICAFLLPIAQYPPIAPPQVQVTTTYTGADALSVARTVTTPIEQQINGTKGLIYYSSDSTSNGVSNIVATFDVGYSQDIAAVDIQIVSALPMGASLPLLVGDPARRGPVGAAVGRVLGLNFIGAGAGCLVGVVLAFVSPWVGAQAPFYVAVAVNAIVALGAMVAHRRGLCERAVAAGVAQPVYRPRPPMLALGPLLWFAAAGGFVALAFEIFFLRIMSYATGSGAIAFAVTAGTFLAGLAMGARQAGANCKTLTRDGAMRRAVGVLMRGSLLALLFLPLIAHLGWLDRGVVAVAVLMIYLVARCWGALIPYLAELGIAPDGAAGLRVAIVGVANSLGAAAGAIVTSFVLIDGLGLVATGMALVGAGLACAMTLVGALVMPRPEKILRVSLAAALGLLALVMAPRSSADVRERLQWITASEAGALAPAVDDGGR